MSLYLDSLTDLFSSPKERTFTDRTEVLDLLYDALTRINEDPNLSQVFMIHGIGGVGKTRLVKEFIKNISPEPVIYVSFEIEKRTDVINNLYQIRKAINAQCPFFDFALLRYLELTNPTVLNDDFMLLFQKSFFVDIINVLAELLGCASSAIQNIVMIPTNPSPSAILDFMNKIYHKFPQLLHNNIIKAISSSLVDELATKLPILLGIEIGRLIEKEKIKPAVFIFDSYQESQPYSESEEWLFHLINAASKGLYIITSREPMHWKNKQSHLIIHRLECYPEDEAKKLLEETIKNRPDLVHAIIESTQCVPIYIDLALNIYEHERDVVGESFVDKVLFRDRRELVNHFISHFRPSLQTAITDLAIIRVFNYDIFCELSKQHMIGCAPYEYNEIIRSNLFNYVSKSQNSDLVKLHDVFCRDIYESRDVRESYTIVKTYLKYVCYRRDYILTENYGVTLVALFQNIILLLISIERRLYQEYNSLLDIDDIECLLDIFLTLSSNRIRFVPPSYFSITTESMGKVCKFICAKTYEKNSTLKTIELLEEIGDTSCFGKHSLSYNAILYYNKSLTGSYDQLEAWVNSVDNVLDENMKGDWFYNRIKIYQADCCMLRGKFKTAQASLLLLENGFFTREDYYTIHRTIGHIQRLNFQLDDAYITYSNLLNEFGSNTVYYEYLVTNLIETQCYFPDRKFIGNAKKVLDSMVTPYNTKNKGKVLYGLAIANIVKKHYKSAQKCIDECIKLNKEDGYQSGELFGFMAQAYLDYSQSGIISEQTNKNIEKLLSQNGVYTFFRLQLALMNNDTIAIKNIEFEYEWIDYEYTKKECRRFISKILIT